MENEKAKKLAEMVSGLPEQMQNLALNYIQGLVDGRAIREAMEKKKKEETETRGGGVKLSPAEVVI